MSRSLPPDCSKLAKNPKIDNDVTIFRHHVNINFFFFFFFDVFFFLQSNLVTGPSFMSILSLLLELWQISFIGDWPEIWKLEIPASESFPITGDWGKLWIPILARMSLIECYWMMQNSRVAAFNFFGLLRENPLGGG